MGTLANQILRAQVSSDLHQVARLLCPSNILECTNDVLWIFHLNRWGWPLCSH